MGSQCEWWGNGEVFSIMNRMWQKGVLSNYDLYKSKEEFPELRNIQAQKSSEIQIIDHFIQKLLKNSNLKMRVDGF